MRKITPPHPLFLSVSFSLHCPASTSSSSVSDDDLSASLAQKALCKMFVLSCFQGVWLKSLHLQIFSKCVLDFGGKFLTVHHIVCVCKDEGKLILLSWLQPNIALNMLCISNHYRWLSLTPTAWQGHIQVWFTSCWPESAATFKGGSENLL